jgi:bis(5'-nucleosyl)-tetraphosphatase (symmetrical)
MRRIFIGDVQGCAAELDALLAAIGLAAGDQVTLVGDLVNRGPDSLGVLRHARAIGARAVLGNHDFLLLRVARRRTPGEERFRDVLAAPDGPELLDWLGRQPVLALDDDIAVVHGGLHPRWDDLPGLAAEMNARVAEHVRGRSEPSIEFATTVRYCDAEGRRPPADDPPPPPPFEPWDRFYRGARTVVFGHWARRGLVVGPRLRGLDSGCVYGGALTAWIAEEDRIVQVPGWRRPA